MSAKQFVASSAAVLVAAVPAALTAWLYPRGPWTEHAAFATVVGCTLVGYVVGQLVRSRWAYAAPLVFGLILELGRLDVVGPSVDPPRLDQLGNPITWVAVLGPRIVHALLAAVPMLVGTRIARTWAVRPTGSTEPTRRPRAWLSAVLGALVAVEAAFVAIPPRTDAIPGGIAEFRSVTVNGRTERMLLRGKDVNKPVLLWLSGGPGGTEMGSTPKAFAPLESDFIVVNWDQPGAGLSATALPRRGVTLDDAVADTIALTEYLKRSFKGRSIVLAGNSGGTFVGILAVKKRPDLYAAYVGSGQMVDVTATDIAMYDAGLAWASKHDPAYARQLRGWGRPPYPTDKAFTYLPVLSSPGHDYGPAANVGGTFPGNLFKKELGPIGAVGSFFGMIDTFAIEYPTWDGIDLRRSANAVSVPVFLVQGTHEHPGRQDLAREWFRDLRAPAKEWITCPTAGHRCMTQDPARWAQAVKQALQAGRTRAS